jgi:hypothetical protein
MSAFFEGTGESEPVQALLADNRAYRLAHAFAAIQNTALRLRLVALVEKIAEAAPAEKRHRRG